MSEYYPVCPHKPCPVCHDISGKCEINEYGYVLLCYGMPQAKKEDLEGSWKCFRQTGEYSQWKDQRADLEARYRDLQVKITVIDSNGQVLDTDEALTKFLDESLRKHKERRGEI